MLRVFHCWASNVLSTSGFGSGRGLGVLGVPGYYLGCCGCFAVAVHVAVSRKSGACSGASSNSILPRTPPLPRSIKHCDKLLCTLPTCALRLAFTPFALSVTTLIVYLQVSFYTPLRPMPRGEGSFEALLRHRPSGILGDGYGDEQRKYGLTTSWRTRPLPLAARANLVSAQQWKLCASGRTKATVGRQAGGEEIHSGMDILVGEMKPTEDRIKWSNRRRNFPQQAYIRRIPVFYFR